MRVLILSFLIGLFLATGVYAAPCYGTRMPAQKSAFIGVQSYTIFKRYQEHSAGKLRSSQEFLLVSYGLFDWLVLDLKGGAGLIKQHLLAADEIDYPSYLGGGYGLRLRLFEKNNFKGVFGFQHISIHPYSVDLGPVKHKAVLDDWQFSLLGSYQFKKITPYLGTRWSRADYIHWVDGERDRIKSDLTKSLGLIFGFDLPVSERIWLNFEGSAFDSQAFAASINYSF